MESLKFSVEASKDAYEKEKVYHRFAHECAITGKIDSLIVKIGTWIVGQVGVRTAFCMNHSSTAVEFIRIELQTFTRMPVSLFIYKSKLLLSLLIFLNGLS